MLEDARRTAALLVKRLNQASLKNDFCCYGTKDSVLIGIGRKFSLNLVEVASLDTLWFEINTFIVAHSDEYIFGFVGFDPANLMGKDIGHLQKKIDLFVPNIVIECKGSDYKLVRGDTEISNMLVDLDNVNPVDIDTLDHAELRQQYANSVERIVHAINTGEIERATLARKVASPKTFNLCSTFISDHSEHDLARNFYFSNQHIAFSGQSPELLAEGNSQLFATHKLSGTYAKNDALTSAELITRFKSDPRIISEHASSIAAIGESLTGIGSVQSSKFQVMELPALLHGWSKFVTRPVANISIADCLRSIFPYGANPLIPAFELLAEHENFCRGPYYGLVGYISPNAEFSFTQVLRSAFTDRSGSYLLVGAAITGHSTADLEMKESCNKLSSIKVFEPVD